MAAHVLVLYGQPTDPAAFDAYYKTTHVPIAKKMPGLKSYTLSKGISAGGETPPYHLIADLAFDSMAAIGAAVGSPEGQAAVADVPNFATGGATILTYESEDV